MSKDRPQLNEVVHLGNYVYVQYDDEGGADIWLSSVPGVRVHEIHLCEDALYKLFDLQHTCSANSEQPYPQEEGIYPNQEDPQHG